MTTADKVPTVVFERGATDRVWRDQCGDQAAFVRGACHIAATDAVKVKVDAAN